MSNSVTTIAPHEQVLLVQIERPMLNDNATEQLDSEVSAAAAERAEVPVVLDLAKVRFVPSVALGALVNLNNGLNMAGRRLILINVIRQVRGTAPVRSEVW